MLSPVRRFRFGEGWNMEWDSALVFEMCTFRNTAKNMTCKQKNPLWNISNTLWALVGLEVGLFS